MNRLAEVALKNSRHGVFTGVEVAHWLQGTPASRHGHVKRALAGGEILKLRRGLYCLSHVLPGVMPDPMFVAQYIAGPSYVSFETALSYHGAIPESVHIIANVYPGRRMTHTNALGRFTYVPVPQETLYAGVERIDLEDGRTIMMAHPAKALADLVYTRRDLGVVAGAILANLRIDRSALDDAPLLPQTLAPNYRSARVRTFLENLHQELRR